MSQHAVRIQSVTVARQQHGASVARLRADRDEDLRPALSGLPGRRKFYSAKQVIYGEGEAVDKVIAIHDGLVKLVKYLPNGRARIVRLHAKGQLIGLEGLLGARYNHAAIAVADVQLEYFPIDTIRQLERDNIWRLNHLLRQWHVDLTEATRWIADFSTGGIKPRVARLLGYLAELGHGNNAAVVELLTVSEMADILGVTQESVSRVLAALKRAKVLCRANCAAAEIYHIETAKLRRLARQ